MVADEPEAFKLLNKFIFYIYMNCSEIYDCKDCKY